MKITIGGIIQTIQQNDIRKLETMFEKANIKKGHKPFCFSPYQREFFLIVLQNASNIAFRSGLSDEMVRTIIEYIGPYVEIFPLIDLAIFTIGNNESYYDMHSIPSDIRRALPTGEYSAKAAYKIRQMGGPSFEALLHYAMSLDGMHYGYGAPIISRIFEEKIVKPSLLLFYMKILVQKIEWQIVRI